MSDNTTPAGSLMEPHIITDDSLDYIADEVMGEMTYEDNKTMMIASMKRLRENYERVFFWNERRLFRRITELATANAQHAQLTTERDALAAELAAVRAEPRWESVPDGEHTLMDTDDAFVSVTVVDAGKQTIKHWSPGGKTPGTMPDNYRLCRLVPGQDTQPTGERSE